MTITDARKKEGSSPRVLVVRKGERGDEGGEAREYGSGNPGKGRAGARQRVHSNTDKGLNYRTITGRSVPFAFPIICWETVCQYRVPRTLDNAHLPSHLGHRVVCSHFRTHFPFSRDILLLVPFLFSPVLLSQLFRLSSPVASTVSRTPRGHVIRYRFSNCLIPPV